MKITLLYIVLFVLLILGFSIYSARKTREYNKRLEAERLLSEAKKEWYLLIGKSYEEARQRDIVHKCSLKVSMSARENPNEYVYKYFYKNKDEKTKVEFERFCENAYEYRLKLYSDAVASRDDFCYLLKQQTLSTGEPLTNYIHPTWEILPPQKPKFLFWYISPKGNSQNTTSVLATPEVMNYIRQKEEWRNSAAGQRSLMTPKLRAEILKRDNYTCKICGNSTMNEPNLLLEVDHIIPVSKGGKTIAENLQTLCWKCNRSKSNKVG